MSISTQNQESSNSVLDEKCASMQKETTFISGDRNIVQLVVSVEDRKKLVSTTVVSATQLSAYTHDPTKHPKLVCKWNGMRWEFGFDDKNATIQINQRQKNLLIQDVRLFISRRMREMRVRSHSKLAAASGEVSPKAG